MNGWRFYVVPSRDPRLGECLIAPQSGNTGELLPCAHTVQRQLRAGLRAGVFGGNRVSPLQSWWPGTKLKRRCSPKRQRSLREVVAGLIHGIAEFLSISANPRGCLLIQGALQ